MDHVTIPPPQDMELFSEIVVNMLSMNKILTVSLLNLAPHHGVVDPMHGPKIPAVEALKIFGYEKFVNILKQLIKYLLIPFPTM